MTDYLNIPAFTSEFLVRALVSKNSTSLRRREREKRERESDCGKLPILVALVARAARAALVLMLYHQALYWVGALKRLPVTVAMAVMMEVIRSSHSSDSGSGSEKGYRASFISKASWSYTKVLHVGWGTYKTPARRFCNTFPSKPWENSQNLSSSEWDECKTYSSAHWHLPEACKKCIISARRYFAKAKTVSKFTYSTYSSTMIYNIIIYEKGPRQKPTTLRNSLIYCQKLLRNYLDVTKSDEMWKYVF